MTTGPVEGVALVRERDGLVLYANDSWARLFGSVSRQIVGHRVSVPANAVVRDSVRAALDASGKWEGPLELLSATGDVATYWAQVCAFDDKELGRILSWYTVRQRQTA